MKKNEKGLRFLLKKNAGDQIFIIGIWLSVVLLLFLAAGAFLNFILGKIILSITTASIGVVILKNAWWVILIICLGIFISHALKTIYKSRVIIPERHVALLECFNEFVGEDEDTIDESRGVIHEGLHFVFPYFNIFKINGDAPYFLGRKTIELFKGLDVKKDFPIDVKDTSVNLTATIIIKIDNPIFAAYKIDNYQDFIVKKCEAALRKKCAQCDLEELLETRKDLTLKLIFSDLNSEGESVDIEEIKKVGVNILDFIVTDVGVQQKDLEQREKILKAKNDQLAKSIENETKKQEAETKRIIVGIDSETEAKRVQVLAEANASKLKIEGEALKKFKEETGFSNDNILAKETIGAIKPTDKLITSAHGVGGLGAEIAFGANFGNKKDEKS